MPGIETRARARTELPAALELPAGDYVVAAGISADVWRRGVRWAPGAGELIGLDLATGGERFRVRAHPAVLGVTIEPGSGRIASCGQDGKAALWSDRGERLAELAGSRAPAGGPGSSRWRGHPAAAPWPPPRAAPCAERDGGELPAKQPRPRARGDRPGLATRDGGELASSSYGEVRLLAAGGAAQRALRWKGSLMLNRVEPRRQGPGLREDRGLCVHLSRCPWGRTRR